MTMTMTLEMTMTLTMRSSWGVEKGENSVFPLFSRPFEGPVRLGRSFETWKKFLWGFSFLSRARVSKWNKIALKIGKKSSKDLLHHDDEDDNDDDDDNDDYADDDDDDDKIWRGKGVDLMTTTRTRIFNGGIWHGNCIFLLESRNRAPINKKRKRKKNALF